MIPCGPRASVWGKRVAAGRGYGCEEMGVARAGREHASDLQNESVTHDGATTRNDMVNG